MPKSLYLSYICSYQHIDNLNENFPPFMSTEIEEIIAPATNGYGADSIQVLEGLEAVRKRPAMYIGDIGVKGLHHLVYEVVDNSIDEALAGYCKNITVTIHEDNSVSVQDDGRGIPTGITTKEKKSALEIVMTVLHAGGKFDKDTYKVSGGLHGVGVSCVNALSSRLLVTVDRENKKFEQEYKIGVPQYEVREIGTSTATGTRVHFWPDASIFTVSVYNKDILEGRLRELSFLNRKITIILNDLREKEEDGTTYTKTFYSEGGIVEFVEMLDKKANRQSLLPTVIYCDGHDTASNVMVEVAMIYNTGYQEHLFSYVNNINTIEGGTHVAGFRRSITRVFKSYGEKEGLFEKAKVEIEGDDFREGLSAIISVKVPEPQFEGQTKTKLGNSEVMGVVDTTLSRVLASLFGRKPKERKNNYPKSNISRSGKSCSQESPRNDTTQKRFNRRRLTRKTGGLL